MGLPLCSGGFVRVCNVLGKIVILQNTNVQEIKDDYINKNYREATLKAAEEIFCFRRFYSRNNCNAL
jgi:cell division protein FtsI (penicillin-binding protein 3)